LMSLNDSKGILSARPCACRGGRPPTALASLDVLSGWVAVWGGGLAVVVWGVTKYVNGMYLLVVASRTAASWPLHRNLSNS
jgi:hypothetical protein